MKVLITGHKGFVGSYLFQQLKKNKHKVIGYDRNDSFPSERVDLIYHLAANPKVYESIKTPEQALENIQCTFNVLMYMKRFKVKNLIYASSTEIPGLKTPYSASKLASENLIEAFCNCYNFGAVSLRFSNIYGKEDRKDRFIPTIIEKAKKGQDIDIYGKNGNFIYIDDCIKVYLKTPKLIELGKHKVYEVIGQSVSLISVARKVLKLTGSKSRIKLDNGLKRCLK